MRFAGTASQYSKKAMPQLASTAIQSALERYLRWPYQAKVMNTFEATSSTTGVTKGLMRKPSGRVGLDQGISASRSRKAGKRRAHKAATPIVPSPPTTTDDTAPTTAASAP